MAEGIMKNLMIDEYEKHGRVVPIEIASAGTHTVSGQPASHHAVDVARAHEINLSFHRSKPLTESMVARADLILTMGSGHRRHIESVWPGLDTVCEIKKYLRPESGAYEYGDILDPIGMGRDVYKDVFDEIDDEIRRVVDNIVREAVDKYGNE